MKNDSILHSQYSQDKKMREFQLIEQFLTICPDFRGYKFVGFSENPDMIYAKENHSVGFDSVIISEDQASADCYFDASMCKIGIPTKLTEKERADKITVFFENKLFKHFRRYDTPTVLVFSLVDISPTTFSQLYTIAKRFKLPEFSIFNITDYYLCDSKQYLKIDETNLGKHQE